eukprot:5842853-Prymnesium_polylepis.1
MIAMAGHPELRRQCTMSVSARQTTSIVIWQSETMCIHPGVESAASTRVGVGRRLETSSIDVTRSAQRPPTSGGLRGLSHIAPIPP